MCQSVQAPSRASLISCWVVTDGKPGMENQCLGLAEALGLAPEIKRVRLRQPWRWLSPYLRLGKRFAAGPAGDLLTPPWPDLVIATGRHSVVPALAARAGGGGRTFLVQIQNPAINLALFDLVVVPRHDRLRGANVIVTRGALHRVTAKQLESAAARLGTRFDHLPRPRVAVLIGGDNGVYRLSRERMAEIAGQLAGLCRTYGAGLLVTPSRRTGAENTEVLRQGLQGLPAIVWDGRGENPYFAFLGMADAIVVTCDSVSMVSEACSTGKPVYVIGLEGGSRKFSAFLDGLRQDGVARPFVGELDHWDYVPLDDTRMVAEEIRRRLPVLVALSEEPKGG
ncbi:Nucleoside-diphosphate sugar epimerase [uncultured Gammaproteobacteria bacterium]